MKSESSMGEQEAVSRARPNEGVRAVDRALSILLAFGSENEDLSASELTRRTGLTRPTFYRLVASLEKFGFVRAYGEPQGYRLGPAVAKLAHVWSSTLKVAEIARPVLREVWQQTGETVALFVRQGDQRMCVAELPSSQPLSFKRGVGYSESILLGASGRVLLAYSESGRDELKRQGMKDDRELDVFLAELARVREQGYAFSRNELIQGAVAVAAPFFNYDGSLAGAVGVFGPEVRVDDRRIGEFAGLLADACARLSRELGYDPD